MAMPPVIARAHKCQRRKKAFYFADLVSVDRQSTAKTTKIGSLKNFQPYGICYPHVVSPNLGLKMIAYYTIWHCAYTLYMPHTNWLNGSIFTDRRLYHFLWMGLINWLELTIQDLSLDQMVGFFYPQMSQILWQIQLIFPPVIQL